MALLFYCSQHILASLDRLHWLGPAAGLARSRMHVACGPPPLPPGPAFQAHHGPRVTGLRANGLGIVRELPRLPQLAQF